MEKVTRRGFVAGTGLTLAGAALAAPKEEKVFDGGLAPVSEPGIPQRKLPLVPAGAKSLANFTLKCTACQLCVSACPNKVLRPSKDPKRFMQPEMGFEKGYCKDWCKRCTEVCPTGAITPITLEQKKVIHLGHAIWHEKRCIAAQEGVACSACQRHCPTKAITLIPLNPDDKKSKRIPVIDKAKCIACGACEHLCPARPFPAMTVKGFEVHRETKPMGDKDVLAAAMMQINKGKASVLLIKGGVIVSSAKGSGIKPLLDMFDYRKSDLNGAWVVDKVIGRAAAAICIAGGAVRVHASVICDGAIELLKAHNIQVSFDERTKEIINRKKDGICPMEKATEKLSNPGEMIKAIRKTLKKLSK